MNNIEQEVRFSLADRKKLIGLEEAALLINITKEQIRILVKEKKIRGRKIGKPWRFHPDQLEQDFQRYLEDQEWESSSKDQTVHIGGTTSRRQMVKEYESQLKLKTKR